MNEAEVLENINNRIQAYINKSNAFNSRKTIIICDGHEVEETIEFFSDNQLRIDILDIYIDDNSVMHQLTQHGNNANCFISKKIITDGLYDEIKKNNTDFQNIYVGPTSKGYFDLYEKRNNIIRNIHQITTVINMLDDEKSKNVFLNILTRLSVPYQFHFYYETEDFPQYFCNEFRYSKTECFLDAGVCNGINIFEFVNKVNWKYNKIIGLEGDSNNYNIAKRNLFNIDNTLLLPKVLYDYDGSIRFLSTQKSTKKSNSRVGEDGDVEVACIAGDSLKEPFTFIKMDIEGSEKNALDGLRETIKKYHPKLAICIYHFQADFWEVPLKIHEIDSTYKFKIRNHKKLDNLTETVVYAWN